MGIGVSLPGGVRDTKMDVEKYLKRINFSEKPDTSLDSLYRLQVHHQQSVPFENLAVFQGKKKELCVSSLYRNIVVQGRGGWCCELNGLFAWLLSELGFIVRLVSASAYNDEKREFNGDFDHLALVVELG